MPILSGRSYPIGATVEPDGVNFCVHSRNATAIDLLLFDTADAALSSPADLSDPPAALPIGQRQYHVQARPSVILVAGLTV